MMKSLRSALYDWLLTFVSDPFMFRLMLCDTESILSGSFMVRLILQNTEFNCWSPNDLDVYIAITTGETIVHFLQAQGYQIMGGEDSSSDNKTYDNVYGVSGIIHMFKEESRTKIDVITSTHATSMLPLASFWGTLVMNALSMDMLCIPYQRLTLWGSGCFSLTGVVHTKLLSCVMKYHNKGFELNGFTTNGANHGVCGNQPLWYCPHARRFLGDKGCLTIHFGQGDGALGNIVSSYQFYLAAQWRMGAEECEGGCNLLSTREIQVIHTINR